MVSPVRGSATDGACGVSSAKQVLVFGRIVVQEPVLIRLSRVPVREIRRSPDEGAIGVELDSRESQPFVPKGRNQPKLKDIVEQARDDHQVHAHRQATRLSEAQVGLELPSGDLGVEHGRDAGAEDRILRRL